ncbi:MAG: helix-turn-helix domain-containing protein [Clostridia bacterium]|nr:helix-turn-helix domain-containing protein [Clostridia bacterium]
MMKFFSEIINRENFIIEYGSHIMDSVIIVLEGRFSFSVHGKNYIAEKNDICVFPKDTLFERIVQDRIKCIYIQFDSFPMPLPSGLLKTIDPIRTENTIKHLVQTVTDKNEKLAEHFMMDILLLHNTPPVSVVPDDIVVSACIAYFSKHCNEHITLDVLAKKFFISKQGLILKFKKHTGKTPMEYLSFIRIDSAKLLLRDTSLSIGEIAARCGFENIYYFSNCFKNATGMSPSRYKSQIAFGIKQY